MKEKERLANVLVSTRMTFMHVPKPEKCEAGKQEKERLTLSVKYLNCGYVDEEKRSGRSRESEWNV